ncbi:hypothetical protein BGZ81_009920 [Podila clonocystis]|nr:hypothetical protein BGZ81_009920 [Podila clonocystis]
MLLRPSTPWLRSGRSIFVVIVDYKGTPSATQQLAFDYYSKVIQVFQGTHDNIIFLHTHVNYGECHPSNKAHHDIMHIRHKAFSRLLRGKVHKAEQRTFCHSDIMNEEVKLYPMHTIDLKDHSKRPIRDYMTRNTLRDILQLVVASPSVALDSSHKSLFRIWGISHPDELNKMQRDKILYLHERSWGTTKKMTMCLRAVQTEGEGDEAVASSATKEEISGAHANAKSNTATVSCNE